jgi:hypothetical protein
MPKPLQQQQQECPAGYYLRREHERAGSEVQFGSTRIKRSPAKVSATCVRRPRYNPWSHFLKEYIAELKRKGKFPGNTALVAKSPQTKEEYKRWYKQNEAEIEAKRARGGGGRSRSRSRSRSASPMPSKRRSRSMEEYEEEEEEMM